MSKRLNTGLLNFHCFYVYVSDVANDLHGSLHAGFILTSVQRMLDVVLFARTLSTAQFFLGLSYHGVSSGPLFPNMLETGIQLTLVAIILKVFMDIRYGKPTFV